MNIFHSVIQIRAPNFRTQVPTNEMQYGQPRPTQQYQQYSQQRPDQYPAPQTNMQGPGFQGPTPYVPPRPSFQPPQIRPEIEPSPQMSYRPANNQFENQMNISPRTNQEFKYNQQPQQQSQQPQQQLQHQSQQRPQFNPIPPQQSISQQPQQQLQSIQQQRPQIQQPISQPYQQPAPQTQQYRPSIPYTQPPASQPRSQPQMPISQPRPQNTSMPINVPERSSQDSDEETVITGRMNSPPIQSSIQIAGYPNNSAARSFQQSIPTAINVIRRSDSPTSLSSSPEPKFGPASPEKATSAISRNLTERILIKETVPEKTVKFADSEYTRPRTVDSRNFEPGIQRVLSPEPETTGPYQRAKPPDSIDLSHVKTVDYAPVSLNSLITPTHKVQSPGVKFKLPEENTKNRHEARRGEARRATDLKQTTPTSESFRRTPMATTPENIPRASNPWYNRPRSTERRFSKFLSTKKNSLNVKSLIDHSSKTY